MGGEIGRLLAVHGTTVREHPTELAGTRRGDPRPPDTRRVASAIRDDRVPVRLRHLRLDQQRHPGLSSLNVIHRQRLRRPRNTAPDLHRPIQHHRHRRMRPRNPRPRILVKVSSQRRRPLRIERRHLRDGVQELQPTRLPTARRTANHPPGRIRRIITQQNQLPLRLQRRHHQKPPPQPNVP